MGCCSCVFVCFFKQKTAYEMRISDWSSDVCSSDLMNWLYDQYGYVRLLGLAHLVFWTPVYGWILMKRKAIAAPSSWFGRYLVAYLVVDGISLAIDEIGRASCRERVCQYVSIAVVAVYLKKKTHNTNITPKKI